MVVLLICWHGHGPAWGYKSIVFWDLYMSDGIPVLCLGPVFCIIILYKSLPEQSLEIMRHNINGSMAEQKR